MPSITLKNIPEPLYEKIKEAARINHRSLNGEILYRVGQTLDTHNLDVEKYLLATRKLREKTAAYPITDELLNEAKNQGRP